jgi:hypothetical protein
MRTMLAVVLALFLCVAESRAQTPDCPVPNYLLFGDNALERVHTAVSKRKSLKILVLGTASSTLPGRDGVASAFPARLEAALKRRLPGVAITVGTVAKPRQTARQMADSLEKLLLDEKPDLMVWQSGTFDALQGTDPELYRASVAEGIDVAHARGADVILMNMQYSPRTETMVSMTSYIDNMRVVAQQRDVPVFDRFTIMSKWNESGEFDLVSPVRGASLAKRVHSCLGSALSTFVIETARITPTELGTKR